MRWLGVRWAAKEAAFKAKGGVMGWKEVEVEYHPSGRTLFNLDGSRQRAN